MARNRLNVRLVIGSAVVVALLTTGTALLHGWQMRRHARGQLEQADLAEKAGEAKEAAAALGRSVAFDPDNVAVRTRRALMLADQATTHRERHQALAALRSVLPPYGGDLNVRLRAAELALTLGDPREACLLL